MARLPSNSSEPAAVVLSTSSGNIGRTPVFLDTHSMAIARGKSQDSGIFLAGIGTPAIAPIMLKYSRVVARWFPIR